MVRIGVTKSFPFAGGRLCGLEGHLSWIESYWKKEIAAQIRRFKGGQLKLLGPMAAHQDVLHCLMCQRTAR